MGRKGRSVTLSLSEEDKGRLEALALEYGMMWGDRPNISELIQAIAQNKLKVASNHDWPRERVELLEKARLTFIDKGEIQAAIALAEFLSERSELTIPQRQELARFLARDIRPWRVEIERYIQRQQPFRLNYLDAAERPWQFTVYYAQISPRGDREYLDCWCEECDRSEDVPALMHNRTLRLDRIVEATVSKVSGRWRNGLDSLEVILHLYDSLAKAYQTKQGQDVVVEWLGEPPAVLKIVRKITSTFWFKREILPYGSECEVIAPSEVREQITATVQRMAQRYGL